MRSDRRGFRRALAIVAGLSLLAGCVSPPARPPVLLIAPPDPDAPPRAEPWTEIATPEDAALIAGLADVWTEALAFARQGGFVRAVANEGALLEAGAGQPRAALPPGRYQCRLIRIGAPPGRRLRRGEGYAAFKQQFCYVDLEGPLTTLVKETGSDRQAGRLWPDDDARMIFLGALALGGEDAPPGYGFRRERDVVGVLERIGPLHWRLAMPRPRGQALIDVLELKPYTGD